MIRAALGFSTAAFLLVGDNPAQGARTAAVEVAAAVSAQPVPSIALSWPADASATLWTVARRPPGQLGWGAPITVPGGGGATGWTDTQVAVGQRYEYRVIRASSPPGRGFVTAGIEAAALEDRGYCILVVDASVVAALGSRLDRLARDLVGDGFEVVRFDVQPTDPVTLVKARIAAEASARPGREGSVFLLGKVPVPYSGRIFPDGHGNHVGAWPADVYYGELDGTWTDTVVNTTSASRAANHNVPGDGKFDQSTVPSDVDLAVGRVDLSNMPAFGVSEEVLLQRYLDKDHEYRHRVIAADPRAVIDDNFGFFSGEAFAASGWRAFSAIVGSANVTAADYFGTLDVPSGGGHVWSYGCGGGSYTSASGIGNTARFVTSHNRGVFTMLFGSYFGDWDVADSFLRAPLCAGWTLTNAWAGRPHWSFHPMGLGQTVGACARLSQNDTSPGGVGGRGVHVALMGDPTLRQHVVAPPLNLTVVDQWPSASLSWTISSDPVAGYHVYRSASADGPFSRLTATPVASSQWIDPSALRGPATYMVRAIRLEQTPTGSYWNLSQGAFAEVCLPTAPASHTAFGAGCYAVSDSFYQEFGDVAAAAASLNGRSLRLTPGAAGGYDVVVGPAVWMPPGSGAVALALADDDQVQVPLPQPFAYPGGTTTALSVHSNGIVTAAPSLLSAAPAEPAALLGTTVATWACWHDLDPTEPGSGSVWREVVAGRLVVTWDGVEGKPAGQANPNTLQMVFDPATGTVDLTWSAWASVGTGNVVVGWSPAGPSVDAGSVDVLAGPFSVGLTNLAPLRLSASPAPISTQTSGTLVSYALDDAPPFAPGQHVGLLVFGFAADRTGADLSRLGLPGCRQWLGSTDWVDFVSSSSPQLVGTLQVPPRIPCGAELFVQGVAFVPPRSLPGGRNPLGAVVSNGIATFVNRL